MSKGHIRPYKGKGGLVTWQIKYDAGEDPKTGKRRQRNVTVRGTKRTAAK